MQICFLKILSLYIFKFISIDRKIAVSKLSHYLIVNFSVLKNHRNHNLLLASNYEIVKQKIKMRIKVQNLEFMLNNYLQK